MPIIHGPSHGRDIAPKPRTGARAACQRRNTCRVCGSPNLQTVLDLGRQHVAGRFPFPGSADPAEVHPLELVRCAVAGGCGLVQLRHTVAPGILYRDYGYLSGINEAMRENLAGIAAQAEAMVDLRPGDTVLDIGCNDGTLLASYRTPDLDLFGFDASENVAKLAAGRGIDVVCEFFSAGSSERHRRDRKARVVTSIAMFYDLDAPQAFVRDVARCLAPEGVWVLELSYLPAMLATRSFDTICHEHLGYYPLAPLERMLSRSALEAVRVERNAVNGGSFRVFVRHAGAPAAPGEDRESVAALREEERALDLQDAEPFQRFAASVEGLKAELRSLLERLHAEGRRVYGYGASTKGNTILQYCGIDARLVEKIADRNPTKWGHVTPGTGIPIVSEAEFRAERPDDLLVLPWHFLEGFRAREAAFLRQGGRFIVPLPEVRVEGAEG